MFLVFLLVGFQFNSKAQYEFSTQINEPVLKISKEELFDAAKGNVTYQIEGDTLQVLSLKSFLNYSTIELKLFNLKTEIFEKTYTYHFDESIDRINSFYYDEKQSKLYLLSSQFLIVFKNNKIDSLEIIDLKDSYTHMDKLNNELLFYFANPGHPFDVKHEIYFLKYNLSQGTLSDIKHLPLETLVFGNALNRWVRVMNDEIYIVSAFSGVISILDENFNLKRSFTIQLEGLNNTHMMGFLYASNEVLSKETERLLKEDAYLKTKYGENYFYQEEQMMKDRKMLRDIEKRIVSDYFSKSGVDKRMQALQSNHQYIEKLIPYNDSTFIISVWKPENGWMFRDLYFINNQNGLIEKEILNWGNQPNPNLETYQKVEEFFIVPIAYSRYQEAVFYKNEVWVEQLYPLEIFKEGNKKELDQKVYLWNRKNGKQWFMSKYILKD